MPATQWKDYITMFYGPPGVGKTTFVNSMGERVLFLSTDRGTRFLSTMRVDCNSWEHFLAAQQTIASKGKGHYDVVCIDHVDDMSLMCENYVCQQLGIVSLADAGFGKGFSQYRKTILSFVQDLMRLNTGVCFICHEVIKTVKVRSIELQRTMPELSKSAWKVVVPLADLIGYCGFRTVRNTQTGKIQEIRVLETIPREALYLKDRTRRTKPLETGYEPLDGDTFVRTFYGAQNPIGDNYAAYESTTDNSPATGTTGPTRGGATATAPTPGRRARPRR
jgi:Cdc6-like AAA superfamily ATPase